MTYPVSGCAFIRQNFVGAFCIFESMASMLPFVDEFVVLDLGSTDGTLQRLEQIAEANPKVRLERGAFPEIDAGAFATLANDLVGMCSNPNVWYCQADEVPHQGLLKLVDEAFARGEFDLRLWRIQLGYNFQTPKWLPHFVHRVGKKGDGSFIFCGDGMNTTRYLEPPICSDYGGEYFIQWGQMWNEQGVRGLAPYMNQMLLDVSLVGGFRDNVPARRALHAPFWHEEPVIPYRAENTETDKQYPSSQWLQIAMADDRWTQTETPFDIPHIMEWHLGRTRYELRRELFEALCDNDTVELLGL